MNIKIIDKIGKVCPYCGGPARGLGCCGESSAHFVDLYLVEINGKEETMDQIELDWNTKQEPWKKEVSK